MARRKIRTTRATSTKRKTTKRTSKCRIGKKRTCYAGHEQIYSDMRKAGIVPAQIIG